MSVRSRRLPPAALLLHCEPACLAHDGRHKSIGAMSALGQRRTPTARFNSRASLRNRPTKPRPRSLRSLCCSRGSLCSHRGHSLRNRRRGHSLRNRRRGRTTAAPAVTTAFLSSLIEAVGPLTIVLAAAFVRGWQSCVIGPATRRAYDFRIVSKADVAKRTSASRLRKRLQRWPSTTIASRPWRSSRTN